MGISFDQLLHLMMSAGRTTYLVTYGVKSLLNKPTPLAVGDPEYSSVVTIRLHLRV
jgi:hypothetical protein